MTRLLAALALASFSIVASAADKPVPVTVTNPVVRVEVSNADPIPVRDQRVPYQRLGSQLPCGSSTACNIDFDPVPAGKRLVVTYVSGVVGVANGTLPNCLINSSGAGSDRPEVFVPFQRGTVQPTNTRMVASEQILAYFEAGEAPHMFCGLNGTGDTFFSGLLFSLVGYYENL